jgi:hypothetical protein
MSPPRNEPPPDYTGRPLPLGFTEALGGELGGEVGGWVVGKRWECADCDAHGWHPTPELALFDHRHKARHWEDDPPP